MPCHAAVSDRVVTVCAEDAVEAVIKLMKKSKAEYAVVLDNAGVFLGVFSSETLLSGLIPVSVAMVDGVQLDVKVSAAPGVVKRYGNVKPLPVSEMMDRKVHRLLPDAPAWEGVAYLTKYSEPIILADDKGKYLGLVTNDSMLNHLDDVLPTDG